MLVVVDVVKDRITEVDVVVAVEVEADGEALQVGLDLVLAVVEEAEEEEVEAVVAEEVGTPVESFREPTKKYPIPHYVANLFPYSVCLRCKRVFFVWNVSFSGVMCELRMF